MQIAEDLKEKTIIINASLIASISIKKKNSWKLKIMIAENEKLKRIVRYKLEKTGAPG